MATSHVLVINFLQAVSLKSECTVLHDIKPPRLKTQAIAAALSALPSTAHLPQFHSVLTRVNIYKCALNNICCGLGSAEWRTRGDEAHHELMGTYVVSGSIPSLGGFKCHKQPVPYVRYDATQMNEKLGRCL